jgi:NTP pyrophosphatase (non-canonical NTP hydrolase)
MSASFNELQSKVLGWAFTKGIMQHSNPRAQLLKAVSEIGELADAEIKGEHKKIVDGVGDTIICFIIYAEMNGISIEHCLDEAYEEIKNRTGRMVEGGAFIKD